MGAVRVTWFDDSPDSGDPGCICSLCGEMIAKEEAPVRVYEGFQEARFHPDCFSALLLPEEMELSDADHRIQEIGS